VSGRRFRRRPHSDEAQRPHVDVDPVDAQISALLESVEQEAAEAVAPEPDSPSLAPGGAAPKAEPEAHAVAAAREAVSAPAPRRRRRRNPVARERLYYLLFALVLGIGAGLICARILA
jgi:hypothetical protein